MKFASLVMVLASGSTCSAAEEDRKIRLRITLKNRDDLNRLIHQEEFNKRDGVVPALPQGHQLTRGGVLKNLHSQEKAQVALRDDQIRLDVGMLSTNLREDRNEKQEIAHAACATSCADDEACDMADAITGNVFDLGCGSCIHYHSCYKAGSSYGSFYAGDASCIHEDSCAYAGNFGVFSAGNASCVSEDSCYDAGNYGVFKAGNDACTQDYSCSGAGEDGSFVIGDQSCIERFACGHAGGEGGEFVGSDGSCIGAFSCDNAAALKGYFSAEAGSCLRDASCRDAGRNGGTFRVGISTCIAEYACTNAAYNHGHFSAGSGSCLGYRSCYNPPSAQGYNITIGKGACTCDYCCDSLPDGSIIGDYECTSLQDNCRLLTNSPADGPSKAQSSKLTSSIAAPIE